MKFHKSVPRLRPSALGISLCTFLAEDPPTMRTLTTREILRARTLCSKKIWHFFWWLLNAAFSNSTILDRKLSMVNRIGNGIGSMIYLYFYCLYLSLWKIVELIFLFGRIYKGFDGFIFVFVHNLTQLRYTLNDFIINANIK